MASFTLRIKCDNAAFADGDLRAEIARILREVATEVAGRRYGEKGIADVNGNTVGKYVLTGESAR
jgi:hypothetical protein